MSLALRTETAGLGKNILLHILNKISESSNFPQNLFYDSRCCIALKDSRSFFKGIKNSSVFC